MSGTSLPHHTVSALFAFQYKTLRSLNIWAERLFQCLCFCDFVHLFQSTQCPLSNIQQQEWVEGTRWGWIGKRTLCSFTARAVVELLRTTSSWLGCNLSPKNHLGVFALSSLLQRGGSAHPSSFRLTEPEQLSSTGNALFLTNHPCKWQRWCRQWPCRVQAEQLTHWDWQPAKMTTSHSGCHPSHTGRCGPGTLPVYELLSPFPPC